MDKPLLTVVETFAFLRDAETLGVSDAQRAQIVDFVARFPASGDEVVGSGGVRKFRYAGRGKGKSGGYRIMSLYVDDEIPVYLLAILSKGDRANFSAAEVSVFRQFAEGIKQRWRKRRK